MSSEEWRLQKGSIYRAYKEAHVLKAPAKTRFVGRLSCFDTSHQTYKDEGAVIWGPQRRRPSKHKDPTFWLQRHKTKGIPQDTLCSRMLTFMCFSRRFQQSGSLMWTPNSRALIPRTPTKRNPNLQKHSDGSQKDQL